MVKDKTSRSVLPTPSIDQTSLSVLPATPNDQDSRPVLPTPPSDQSDTLTNENDTQIHIIYQPKEGADVRGASDAHAPTADDNDDETDDEILDYSATGCQKPVTHISNYIRQFYEANRNSIWRIFYAILLAGYAVYFGFAMDYSFGDGPSVCLLVLTLLVIIGYAIVLIHRKFGDKIVAFFDPFEFFILSYYTFLRRYKNNSKYLGFIVLVVIGVILVLVFEVGLKNPRNLISLSGVAVYITLFYIFSKHPARVKWRPVFWGLGLQFIFALLILRTVWGYAAFDWAGKRVSEFLAHADAGAEFVFGEAYIDHPFAFKVLPVIVFFSATVSVLTYIGIMQIVVQKIAWFMQKVMGTTAAESVNAAANIFISQSEAPLMIRPLIPHMTRSELHSVCTGGFATVAGSVMAAYIEFGVPANHLLSASVMSAPAALAMSKLFWPETRTSKTTTDHVRNMEKPKEGNILEAASNGASASIKLVAGVAVNLIAFISILHFINSSLMWLGARVGYPYLTFEMICSYVLWPFSFVMGVDMSDCRAVAGLIGIKVSINEFVGYAALSTLIENRKTFQKYIAATGNGSVVYHNDDVILESWNKTLIGGFMTVRSETIATYALCGFSNFGSIGVMLGALGAMAPNRRQDISRVVLRAMIAGNVACFMTACIAGLLFDSDIDNMNEAHGLA
ncbi:solute carrier family 28 member 3-like [Tubulanus polymorphus]|uniref:solute carrier family 28 member 3-like n=1 Tax=Tubulanus polymorphus TaxID=672921 RepID=UPI003DA28FFD